MQFKKEIKTAPELCLQFWGCFSFAVNFNRLMGKFCGAFPACFIDIDGHGVPGNVHLSEPTENLLGAGVIVLGDEALQLGNQSLGFLRCGG